VTTHRAMNWLMLKTVIAGLVVAPGLFVVFLIGTVNENLWVVGLSLVGIILLHIVYPLPRYVADLDRLYSEDEF